MDNKIKNDIPKNVRKRLDDTYENLLADDKNKYLILDLFKNIV